VGRPLQLGRSGAIVLLALLQLALDVGLLVGLLIHGGIVRRTPTASRYGLAAVGLPSRAAVGVHQAIADFRRSKDIEVGIHGLPRQFDGYTILQLTDLHISRLFPASWGARRRRAIRTKLGVDLIAITGRSDRRHSRCATRRHRAVAGLEGDRRRLRDLGQSRIHLRLTAKWDGALRRNWDCSRSRNRHIVLDRDGSKLVLAGHYRPGVAPAPDNLVRDLAAVLEGTPKRRPLSSCSTISRATHETPRSSGVALQLSGHTHGGLILGIDRLARTRQRRLRVGSLRRPAGMDALREQRHRAVWPGFALRVGRPLRIDADHAPPRAGAT